MGDEINKRVGINVVTTASGDGAEKTAAGLQKDEAAARALKQAFDEAAAAQVKAGTAGPSGDKLTAEQERQNDLLEQKRMLSAAVTRQMELEAAGQKEEAAALTEQIAMRKLAIELQQQLQISEQEALEIATQRVLAEAEVAEAIEQQAAASERGILGARGLHHMFGEAFEGAGLGGLGFQLFGIFELVKMIGEAWARHEEAIRKEREEQEKLNDDLQKENAELSKIKDLNELESRRAEIMQQINDLNEKRAGAEGEEYDKINDQIGAQEVLLGKVTQITPKVIDKEIAEQNTKQTLEDQADALDSINQKYDTLLQKLEAELRTKEKIEEIELGAEIAAINRAERAGKITHGEAEQQRLAAQHAADKKKLDEEQAASLQKIKDLNAETEDDKKQALDEQAALGQASAKLKAAKAAQDENPKIIQRGKDAQSQADQMLKQNSQLDYLADSADPEAELKKAFPEQDDPGNAQAVQNVMSQVNLYRNLLKKAAQGTAAQSNQGQLDEAASDAQDDFEDIKSDTKTANKTANSTKKDNAKKVIQEQRAIADREAIYNANVAAQPNVEGEKLDQANQRDQKEKQEQREHQEGEEIRALRAEMQLAREQHNKSAMTGVMGDMRQYMASHNDLTKDMIAEIQKMRAELAAEIASTKTLHSNLKYISP